MSKVTKLIKLMTSEFITWFLKFLFILRHLMEEKDQWTKWQYYAVYSITEYAVTSISLQEKTWNQEGI